MPDYGLKTPTRIKFLFPSQHPKCMECGFELDRISSNAKGMEVFHHAAAIIGPSCKYAGRLFEMEMDIRYLKEVQA